MYYTNVSTWDNYLNSDEARLKVKVGSFWDEQRKPVYNLF